MLGIADYSLVGRSSASEYGVREFDSKHGRLFLVCEKGSKVLHLKRSPWRGESPGDHCCEVSEKQ